ncbi:ERF family protein [Pseudomonas aeruginosa]|uniref:Erf-like ssDNA annealing protein n=1 Tax=Pseudomonas phage PAJU2 TaxID=504346 RepID=UPI000181F389|nr:Erf-like ssDNA annealing protein [Pseudomonas phage PAJU2]BAG75032.1 putative ssDNA annealing protein [Pseudomonas phage PAJU2]HCF1755684.1 ERF family protein [Pseudomonas aeruginosa]HEP9297434.1 ERF family protein [Pseudomonas aeruginosa]
MNEVIGSPANPISATPAVAANSPMGMMLAAVKQGATLEQVEKMMDLQERWEKAEAKKAYDAAFANFKAEAVIIIKGRKVTDGPLKNKSYAELHDVVNAVTPALSKHGLSSSWKLTRDEKDWMEVTCYLRHVGGHEESVSMGGPPDTGGAKNAIQARASTKTYLERYTLKAITGLSEQGDDDDGRPKSPKTITQVQMLRLQAVLSQCSKGTQKLFAESWPDAGSMPAEYFDAEIAKLESAAAKYKARVAEQVQE